MPVVAATIGGRSVNVPEYALATGWSRNTVQRDNSAAARGGLVAIPPRFVQRKTGPTPARLQGVSRFRAAAAPCSCQAPHALLQMFLSIDGALAEMDALIEQMSRELAEYFGSVGTRPQVRILLDSMRACWDMPDMCARPASAEEVVAFKTCYDILKPSLAKTYWPPPEEKPYVKRKWPSERAMCVQYVRLRNRLRLRVNDPAHASRYLTVARYGVRCLRAAPVVQAALATELYGHGPVGRGLGRVFVLVWRFMEPLAAAALGDVFWLPPSALCLAGHTWKLSKSRQGRMHRHAAFRGGIGSLAVSCGRTAYGKVVEVVNVETSVCESAVASAIDQDPELHAPLVEGDPNHCWHACRLTHRFRFLHAPETPCETWGSYLHNIRAAQTNLAASRYAVRLF